MYNINYMHYTVTESRISDVCRDVNYEMSTAYLASPNFPNNYPPNLACSCVVSGTTARSSVRVHVLYLAIRHSEPCSDWLVLGDRRVCGSYAVQSVTRNSVKINFHTDKELSHSGFWIFVESKEKTICVLNVVLATHL